MALPTVGRPSRAATGALVLLTAAALLVWIHVFEAGGPGGGTRFSLVRAVSEERGVEVEERSASFEQLMKSMPGKRTTRWIVVTSIAAPTEDVKRLASLPDWTLVVVGDSKTPADWSLPDVHYLSLETQISLGFSSVLRLPTKSYTRKNAGYLYAIANGAQWIYDTDDDNKPYGKGLAQFDFAKNRTKGLRFAAPEQATIQESLFNPYRHFGRPDMWPRGFPLEHIKNHDHHDNAYRLCRSQRPPAVQQGIVRKDPDVDAIYRLLHAEPSTGLDEAFSQHAPPVMLAPGTYAPWNSQNTLFARSAFFGLFLPTTVAFRVTDIWRSYFTQALLHAAGESVAFVPVNAIQQRNAHSYLKDFDDELQVYDKSGAIVEFISGWRCAAATMDRCTIDLAEAFAARGFWGKEDAQLVQHWVLDLKKIGYVFPEVRRTAADDYPIGKDADTMRNCRRAHISLVHDLPQNASISPTTKSRAHRKIDDFSDLKEWCGKSESKKAPTWLFPAPAGLAQSEEGNTVAANNYQTVAIVTNNYQWNMGMGMLQRMYDAHYAMVIFCGHYPEQSRAAREKAYPEGMKAEDASYPNLRKSSFNYVDLSNEEVKSGYLVYLCIAKVAEMRIQNVKGYVMFSDDVIVNLWNSYDLARLQGTPGSSGAGAWWNNAQYGKNAMERTVGLMKDKYKDDPQVQDFVAELTREVGRNPLIPAKYRQPAVDPFEYLMQPDGWLSGDWYYVPAANLTFIATFAELAHEGGLFLELFASVIMRVLPSEGAVGRVPNRLQFMWGGERDNWAKIYNASTHGMHPVKLSQFTNLATRAQFCDTILDSFYRNTFRAGEKRLK